MKQNSNVKLQQNSIHKTTKHHGTKNHKTHKLHMVIVISHHKKSKAKAITLTSQKIAAVTVTKKT
jgi:hypothetical protein